MIGRGAFVLSAAASEPAAAQIQDVSPSDVKAELVAAELITADGLPTPKMQRVNEGLHIWLTQQSFDVRGTVSPEQMSILNALCVNEASICGGAVFDLVGKHFLLELHKQIERLANCKLPVLGGCIAALSGEKTASDLDCKVLVPKGGDTERWVRSRLQGGYSLKRLPPSAGDCWIVRVGDLDIQLYSALKREFVFYSDEPQVKWSKGIPTWFCSKHPCEWLISNVTQSVWTDDPTQAFDCLRRMVSKMAKGWTLMQPEQLQTAFTKFTEDYPGRWAPGSSNEQRLRATVLDHHRTPYGAIDFYLKYLELIEPLSAEPVPCRAMMSRLLHEAMHPMDEPMITARGLPLLRAIHQYRLFIPLSIPLTCGVAKQGMEGRVISRKMVDPRLGRLSIHCPLATTLLENHKFFGYTRRFCNTPMFKLVWSALPLPEAVRAWKLLSRFEGAIPVEATEQWFADHTPPSSTALIYLVRRGITPAWAQGVIERLAREKSFSQLFRVLENDFVYDTQPLIAPMFAALDHLPDRQRYKALELLEKWTGHSFAFTKDPSALPAEPLLHYDCIRDTLDDKRAKKCFRAYWKTGCALTLFPYYYAHFSDRYAYAQRLPLREITLLVEAEQCAEIKLKLFLLQIQLMQDPVAEARLFCAQVKSGDRLSKSWKPPILRMLATCRQLTPEQGWALYRRVARAKDDATVVAAREYLLSDQVLSATTDIGVLGQMIGHFIDQKEEITEQVIHLLQRPELAENRAKALSKYVDRLSGRLGEMWETVFSNPDMERRPKLFIAWYIAHPNKTCQRVRRVAFSLFKRSVPADAQEHLQGLSALLLKEQPAAALDLYRKIGVGDQQALAERLIEEGDLASVNGMKFVFSPQIASAYIALVIEKNVIDYHRLGSALAAVADPDQARLDLLSGCVEFTEISTKFVRWVWKPRLIDQVDTPTFEFLLGKLNNRELTQAAKWTKLEGRRQTLAKLAVKGWIRWDTASTKHQIDRLPESCRGVFVVELCHKLVGSRGETDKFLTLWSQYHKSYEELAGVMLDCVAKQPWDKVGPKDRERLMFLLAEFFETSLNKLDVAVAPKWRIGFIGYLDALYKRFPCYCKFTNVTFTLYRILKEAKEGQVPACHLIRTLRIGGTTELSKFPKEQLLAHWKYESGRVSATVARDSLGPVMARLSSKECSQLLEDEKRKQVVPYILYMLVSGGKVGYIPQFIESIDADFVQFLRESGNTLSANAKNVFFDAIARTSDPFIVDIQEMLRRVIEMSVADAPEYLVDLVKVVETISAGIKDLQCRALFGAGCLASVFTGAADPKRISGVREAGRLATKLMGQCGENSIVLATYASMGALVGEDSDRAQLAKVDKQLARAHPKYASNRARIYPLLVTGQSLNGKRVEMGDGGEWLSLRLLFSVAAVDLGQQHLSRCYNILVEAQRQGLCRYAKVYEQTVNRFQKLCQVQSCKKKGRIFYRALRAAPPVVQVFPEFVGREKPLQLLRFQLGKLIKLRELVSPLNADWIFKQLLGLYRIYPVNEVWRIVNLLDESVFDNRLRQEAIDYFKDDEGEGEMLAWILAISLLEKTGNPELLSQVIAPRMRCAREWYSNGVSIGEPHAGYASWDAVDTHLLGKDRWHEVERFRMLGGALNAMIANDKIAATVTTKLLLILLTKELQTVKSPWERLIIGAKVLGVFRTRMRWVARSGAAPLIFQCCLQLIESWLATRDPREDLALGVSAIDVVMRVGGMALQFLPIAEYEQKREQYWQMLLAVRKKYPEYEANIPGAYVCCMLAGRPVEQTRNHKLAIEGYREFFQELSHVFLPPIGVPQERDLWHCQFALRYRDWLQHATKEVLKGDPEGFRVAWDAYLQFLSVHHKMYPGQAHVIGQQIGFLGVLETVSSNVDRLRGIMVERLQKLLVP